MDITLFQFVNYFLLLVLFLLFIRYIWMVYFNRIDSPVQWQHAVKEGRVLPVLKQLERKYNDKARFFTWWLQVERLKKEQVAGVFVELGVYKGAGAAVIHHMDPDRQLHLFDTFSGFPANDLLLETGEAATYTPDRFADTSVASVLKKIGGNQNIHVHQGYFPDTARDFDGQVALVSMDADLYNPTSAGLRFFYPRLSHCGVILVHDYNHKWPGIVRAVDEFMKTIPENLIHLPDTDGTVMIIRDK